MDVAKKLREKKQNQKIVFVTAYDHLVFEALHYYPLQFLRKSCLKEDLPGIIQEYINRREEKKIFFRYKRGTEYRNLDTEEMNISVSFSACDHDSSEWKRKGEISWKHSGMRKTTADSGIYKD